MKIADTRLKKTLIIVISSIIITVILVILLISPITKYLIEKYDEKYTGRQIKTGWVIVNPFTGYIHIRNLKIYESKSLPYINEGDSIFFSAKGLSANFAILKLLSKTIEITELTLDMPRGIINQSNKNFNFNDLVTKYTPGETDTIPSQFHFNILNIKIKNGEFHFFDKTIPVNYFIKEVNIESPGKHWNSDTIEAKFSFLSGTGSGSAKGNLTINFQNLDYRLTAIVKKFDLKFIGQYLRELASYGTFSANLDADFKATGNLSDQENLNASGILAINDFHFGKNPDDDYASFVKLVLDIDELSPKDHIYLFDTVLLSHPFFKYESYDYLDNVQMIFGKGGANISAVNADPARFNLILKIADYIILLTKIFFQSDYKINKLVIYNGCLKYNDYSLTEKFSIEANPVNVVADSVNKNSKRVELSLKSGIQPYGNMSVTLSINPGNYKDFDMQYNIQRLPASLFNPYLISSTSFSLDRGTIELNGTWNVRNGVIKSDNNLLVIDPRTTRRLKNNDRKRIPLPLIMYFIRERGNVINYKIPITGNLMNPKFHLRDVIFDMIENIFVKPPTTPYRIHVKTTENEIEKLLTLKWTMRQSSRLPEQEKFIKKMADFLINNPEASIAVYPVHYAEKEKEYIRFFEAKKKYFLFTKNVNRKSEIVNLNEDDSLEVDIMSVKDSLFVSYLNKHVKDTMLFTIQEKCSNFVGSAIINARFKQLKKKREAAFMMHFKQKAVDTRVKIYPGENNIPYNGFSFFKIEYKGEFPKSLIKAYKQMDEFNDADPRKGFAKLRDKIKSLL